MTRARARRQASLRLAASFVLAPLLVEASSLAAWAQVAQAQSGQLQLQLRRRPGALEVVLEGAGPSPELRQSLTGNAWQAELLTSTAPGLKVGPQRFAAPEAGLESISLDGSGDRYQLEVRGLAGMPLQRPVVSADGLNLILTFAAPSQEVSSTASFNLNQPGRLPQPSFAPPLQPRAVAPPLGDMAVGSMMLANRSYLQVSGPKVTITLKNAPARDALMALARAGSYGFVYVGGSDEQAPDFPVNVSFVNENYAHAVNSVLLASGLMARMEGRTIMAGPNVMGRSFGPRLSKVYRLNQVSAGSAAGYLANLGASVTKTNTITTSVTEGVSTSNAVAGSPNASTTQSSSLTEVEAYGASIGPLLGLQATTDSRLSTITLIGDPSLVLVAEQYLKQLDLRQRQVALSVRILDVNLENNSTLQNSFAVRWGNNFIVNDNGQLLGAFGSRLPPSFNDLTGFSPPEMNPGAAYPQNQFFDFLRAQIVSNRTKLLASPTLILQENAADSRGAGGGSAGSGGASVSGALDEYSIDSPIGRGRANEAAVRVGTNVITQYKVNSSANSSGANNVLTCEPTLATAGLVLGARVEKIDDNGFVTFALSPSVSAVTGRELVPGCGFIDILSVRRLDTGSLRVRDGQTLIMTGVISDIDRAVVAKWPLLGDIPLIGSFFRSSGVAKEKRELVIMVTPKILNDGDAYGSISHFQNQ